MHVSLFCVSHLHQILVLLGVFLQPQSPQQVLLSSLDELIKDVEVPLAVALMHDARLLQQVVQDVTSYRSTLPTGTPGARSRGDNNEFLTRNHA